MKNAPCQYCPDRQALCSDSCTKQEYVDFKVDRKLIAEARKANNLLYSYHADVVFKTTKSLHNRKHSIMA